MHAFEQPFEQDIWAAVEGPDRLHPRKGERLMLLCHAKQKAL
jgi:hypothetical protein